MTTKKTTKRPSRRVGDATRARVRDLQLDLVRIRKHVRAAVRALDVIELPEPANDGDTRPEMRRLQAEFNSKLPPLVAGELGAALELLGRAIDDAKRLPGAMRGSRRS